MMPFGMKRTVLLAVVTCGFAFSTAGLLRGAARIPANGGEGDSNNKAGQGLLQMERDWADAMVKNNAEVIARIEADDYTYVMGDISGDKKRDLADARSSSFTGSAELTGMKQRVYGDAAVVTGKASLHNAKYNGNDISGDYLFTDTFVRRGGRWQVVASHSSKVQAM